jgi:hypothetical protein
LFDLFVLVSLLGHQVITAFLPQCYKPGIGGRIIIDVAVDNFNGAVGNTSRKARSCETSSTAPS